MKIRLIITDFDGTLVDTFQANLKSYQQAFESVGLSLSAEQYKNCFGLRFDKFMHSMNIIDESVASNIRKAKSEFYPANFHLLRVNDSLLNFIRSFKRCGVLTAVASTARRKNLENALTYIDAYNDFDLIFAGEDVVNGKPSPEIYNKIMNFFNISPQETLIFEDSPVGIEAAISAGANYLKVENDGINN